MNPAARASFVAKTAKLPDKPQAVIHRGSTREGRWLKILSYGYSGTGKTYLIKSLLELGFRVVVISTDLGGNGLASVLNQCSSEQADRLVNIEFPDYDTLNAFLLDPATVWQEFWDFDPEWLCWDGFTGFQQIHVVEKVLGLDPATRNSSEGRAEGLLAEQQDWGMIRNATMRSLDRFLRLHNRKTGRMIHKYVTCLEGKPAPDKITNEIQRAPYLQGSAQALIHPAFDIIIETRVRTDPSEKTRVYEYWCVGHDKLVAKARGFPLDPVEPADFRRIWLEKIEPILKKS